MTEIEFTGESLRSAEDLQRMIKDAKWQVNYHKAEVQRATDTLYARQLALDALLKEESELLDTENKFLSNYIKDLNAE